MKAKKLLYITASVLFCLFACKKSGSGPGGGINATVNGVSESFNVAAGAEISNNSWASTLMLYGYNNNSATPDILTISLSGPGYITPGRYTFSTKNYDSVRPDMFYSHYYQSVNTAYSQDSASVNTVTITSMNGGSIKGSFSGTLLVDNGSAAPLTKQVISGTFSLPLKSE